MNFDDALERLAADEDARCDLAELAFLLARDEYADLDVDAYLCELNGMAREARNYLGGDLESRVKGLCRYLFHEMGFRGNAREYYDPRNSYLNQVLDRRRGIPITLSVVAMAVGRRAGLEIAGVGLPGHFVAKAVDNGTSVFFDPFHGGRLLTELDCNNLVRQATGKVIALTPAHLDALPVRLIVLRMLNNLKAIYLRQSDLPRAVRTMERLCRLTPDDVVQHRDLGIALLQAGRPSPAIDHLEAYLTAAPEGADERTVRKLLDRAIAEVGRWN
ncbi:MAG TPA: transglutaminase-like domain-containing protein [Gemmataceae bacterium]|nr:transglutaminase-like domain-containing protein [Gemmataceae bacterium]